MEHSAAFKKFMHDLAHDLGPAAGSIRQTAATPDTKTSFHAEITETAGAHVLFCIRTGITATHLDQAAMLIVLTHNMPRQGDPSGVLGMHPEGTELCLWHREPMENLSPSFTASLLKRLVQQTAELSGRLLRCSTF